MNVEDTYSMDSRSEADVASRGAERTDSRRRMSQPLKCAAQLARSLATLVVFAGSSFAQNLPLPVAEVIIRPGLQHNEIEWAEIDPTLGRSVSNVRYVGWDSTSSSEVELIGSYVRDCDFRLTVGKVSEPTPAFGLEVQFAYRIALNRTGTGAPVATDTVSVTQSGIVYPLDPAIAGDLAIRVSGNIEQPGPLGTIPVTISGLNTTNDPSTNYFVTVESPGSLPGTLQLRLAGPYNTLPVPPSSIDTVLTITQANVAIPIQDGMFLTLGTGSAAPGDTAKWIAHHLTRPGAAIEADLEAFSGYHVWRSDLPNLDDFTLLGEISQCQSKFDFVLLTEEDLDAVDVQLTYNPIARTFVLVDRDVHDNFPYRYAVSTYDRGFLGNTQGITYEGELATTEKVYPARQFRERNRQAYVVPNPFKRTADWEEGSSRVVFANLPTRCTIRIFSVATDHVATLEHGPNEARSTSPSSASWDPRSTWGEPLAPGIYIFHIEGTNEYDADGGNGSTVPAAESFEQTGKFIIVR